MSKPSPSNIWIWLSVLGFVSGGYIGIYLMEGDAQRQAIRAGVAYYTVNPRTGEVTFTYRKGCE